MLIPKPTSPIRLLATLENEVSLASIVELLRNEGIPVVSRLIQNEALLIDTLDAQPWDLVVSDLPACWKLAHAHNDNLPILLLEGSLDTFAEDERQGLFDTVSLQHPLTLTNRICLATTLARFERNQRKSQTHIQQLKQEVDSLIQSQQAPLCMIQDGLHVSANPAYLRCLNIADMDLLLQTPFMDLVHASSLSKVKEILKQAQTSETPITESLSFAPLNLDHSIEATAHFSYNHHDDNPVIQIVISPSSSDTQAPQAEPETQILPSNINEELPSEGQAVILKITNLDRLLEALPLSEFSNLTSAFIEHCHQQVGTTLKANFISHYVVLVFPTNTSLEEKIALYSQRLESEGLPYQRRTLCLENEFHILSFSSVESLEECLTKGVRALNQPTPSPEPLALQEDEQSEPETPEASHDELSLETAAPPESSERLSELLQRDSLKPLFLPVASLHGEIEGCFEVLGCFEDQENDAYLSAYELVPNCADANICQEYDQWLVQSAFKTMLELHKEIETLHVFIRLTQHSLSTRFIEWFTINLKVTGINPKDITLLYDEAALLEKTSEVRSIVDKSLSMGTQFGISNLGQVCSEPAKLLDASGFTLGRICGSLSQTILTQDQEDNEPSLETIIKTILTAEKFILVPSIDDMDAYQALWDLGVHYTQSSLLKDPDTEYQYNFEIDHASSK